MPIERYGKLWQIPDYMIELVCFRDGGAAWGIKEPPSKEYHFKNIVKIFWGDKSKKPFVWNPWNERMLKACCEQRYVMLSGSASSGKSYFLALWGIVNWLCDPEGTLVLFTSTSLEDSRRRIWGDVEGFFMAASDDKGKPILPGKLTSSVGKIRTAEGGVKYPDKCGLQLIPGDRAKEKENIGKLIGAKNKRVILLADELPELSPALVEAAKSNLMANPYFQLVGSGNFKSLYDPFGQMCEPIGGWSAVTPDFDDWPTKEGICLRFDCLKSPNVLAGYEKYPGLYKPETLANHRRDFGEHSATFWRMGRSFPCPEADSDRIYSEADLLKGDVLNAIVRWKDEPIKWSSLDPAFVNGGDDAVQTIGLCGTSIENKKVSLVTKQFSIREDIRNKTENRSVQVAKKFRDNCIAEGVKPEYAAYDSSGGGVVFGGLLGEVWSNRLLGVQFGGAASERQASSADRRPCKEAYANRVAEIWHAGVEFIQSGQVKGLTSEICSELTERRKLDSTKAASGLKIRIERKQDMKARTGGKSCDRADSWIIGLELCRERIGFTAVGMEGAKLLPNLEIKHRRRLHNNIYQNATYRPEYAETT